MARKKTTIYLEPELLTAAKTLAASSGRREYEIIEDALRVYVRSEEDAGSCAQCSTAGPRPTMGSTKTRRSRSPTTRSTPTAASTVSSAGCPGLSADGERGEPGGRAA